MNRPPNGGRRVEEARPVRVFSVEPRVKRSPGVGNARWVLQCRNRYLVRLSDSQMANMKGLLAREIVISSAMYSVIIVRLWLLLLIFFNIEYVGSYGCILYVRTQTVPRRHLTGGVSFLVASSCDLSTSDDWVRVASLPKL